MPEDTKTQGLPRKAGFFREGWRELRRKLERRRLRKQLQQQDQQRSQALTQFGQRAWQEQEKVDLSAFPDLREQLGQLEGRAGQLTAVTQDLEAERATLEERRRAEVAKFDGQRQAVEEKKRPADAALRTARDRQSEQEQAIKQLQARVASAAAELAALEQQLSTLAASTAPESKAQLEATRSKQQQLLAERTQSSAGLTSAQAALPGLAAEVNRLAEESQRYAAELSRIEAERKAALSQTDAALDRVRGELRGSQQQAKSVEQERSDRFRQLGLALFAQKAAAAPLEEAMRQVTSIDLSLAATQAALQASLAQSEAMPRNTTLKFSAAMLLGTGLMFAMGAGVYSQLNQPETLKDGKGRREGSVLAKIPPKKKKPECEPLKIACDRLRRWKDCVLTNLGNILRDITTAQLELDAEFASRSVPQEQAEVWRPQYMSLKQQLDALLQLVVNLQAEVSAAVAAGEADCALLPGPEDQKQCQEAAHRAQEALQKTREKLEKDLDPSGPRMLPIRAVLETQGAAWPSMTKLLGLLQMRQTLIRQCQ